MILTHVVSLTIFNKYQICDFWLARVVDCDKVAKSYANSNNSDDNTSDDENKAPVSVSFEYRSSSIGYL